MTTSTAMVFDYADEDSFPETRLAVFIQMSSEVQRVSSLFVESRATGYGWRITTPKAFKSGDKQWACYTNIQPPAAERIPTGVYDFLYEDAAGNEAQSSAIVQYPEALQETKASDIRTVLTRTTDSLALYDKNNVLIYFGKRRNNWNSNASILRDYNTAVTMRNCIAADSNRVVCLLPAEYLIEQPKEADTDATAEADDE